MASPAPHTDTASTMFRDALVMHSAPDRDENVSGKTLLAIKYASSTVWHDWRISTSSVSLVLSCACSFALPSAAFQVFVGFSEGIFFFRARRDIFRNSDHPNEFAFCIPYRKTPRVNPANRAIRPSDPVFHLRLNTLHTPSIEGVRPFTILSMDRFHPGGRPIIDFLARSSPDFVISGADERDAYRFRGQDKEQIANVFSQLAELLFTNAQLLLRLLAFGDVAKVPDSAAIRADRVDEWRRVSIDEPSVLQPELIPALFFPMVIQILHPSKNILGFST